MRIPSPVAGRDLKSLPITPAEAFLLSRIDGTINERELGTLTGLPAEVVAAGLDRLAELGAIDFGNGPARQSRSAPGVAQRTSAPPAQPSKPPQRNESTRPPPLGRPVLERTSQSPPLYDPAELDEVVDIDRDKKQRILDLYYRLDQLSHYELLGVAEGSDKKQIKSAYYQAAPDYHPDKFFRKSLGSYKAKIESVFSRLTLAHDVLTDKARRVEYDEYLAVTQRNSAMEALLEEATRDVASVARAVDEVVASSFEPPASAQRAPSSGRYVEAPVEREPTRTSAPPPVDRAELGRERREALAKKLGFRSSNPPGALRAVPQPSAPPSGDPKTAAMALKARYDAAIHDAKRGQLARYKELGKTALERKDYASAANAFRIAASLAPEDEELQAASVEAQRHAAADLAEGYLKQAQYEAAQDRWGDAALSYSKVCAGRPEDARAHERVAFATLKFGGGTRRAVDFARRAVELAPGVAEFHITLARAYVAAGFEKSAKGELERASELAPGDAHVKQLVNELRGESHAKGKVG